MTKIAYIQKRFSGKSLNQINKANEIIADYKKQGYSLTLRQLYYLFVSKDLLANTQKEYKNLGNVINQARLAGLVSWDAIEDRTRNLMGLTHYDSAAQHISSAAASHRLDLWEDQDNHVEVWFEKEALIGVAEKICNQLRVDFFACRGYTSASEQWSAGQRYIDKINDGKQVHILHFGDHDPSGIDMTRDNKERLRLFLGEQAEEFKIHRMALNMEQVNRYKPPPNPAKPKDSRFKAYKRKFGTKCWELDALEPKVISAIIEKKVISLRNDTKWKKALKREKRSIDRMNELANMA